MRKLGLLLSLAALLVTTPAWSAKPVVTIKQSAHFTLKSDLPPAQQDALLKLCETTLEGYREVFSFSLYPNSANQRIVVWAVKGGGKWASNPESRKLTEVHIALPGAGGMGPAGQLMPWMIRSVVRSFAAPFATFEQANFNEGLMDYLERVRRGLRGDQTPRSRGIILRKLPRSSLAAPNSSNSARPRNPAPSRPRPCCWIVSERPTEKIPSARPSGCSTRRTPQSRRPLLTRLGLVPGIGRTDQQWRNRGVVPEATFPDRARPAEYQSERTVAAYRPQRQVRTSLPALGREHDGDPGGQTGAGPASRWPSGDQPKSTPSTPDGITVTAANTKGVIVWYRTRHQAPLRDRPRDGRGLRADRSGRRN